MPNVIVLDQEQSTASVITRIGHTLGFDVIPFASTPELDTWLASRMSAPTAEKLVLCIVFDARFAGYFLSSLPDWIVATPKIALSRQGHFPAIFNSLRPSLYDFLAKPFRVDDFQASIRCVLQEAKQTQESQSVIHDLPARFGTLTKREHQIFNEISKGESAKKIADALNISVKTLYAHRANLIQKIGVRNVSELLQAYETFNISSNLKRVGERIGHPMPGHASARSTRSDLVPPSFPKIRDLSIRQLVSADWQITVTDAALLMVKNDVSSVVIERNDTFYLLTIEQVMECSGSEFEMGKPVLEITTTPAETIEDAQDALDAFERLENSMIRHLLVTDSGEPKRPIGVVTYTDLLEVVDPSLWMGNRTVGELVSRNEPLTFTDDWYLSDVLHHLKKAEDSIVIVDDEFPIGILTTKDAFRFVSTGTDTDAPLRDFMSSPVLTINESASVLEGLAFLKENRIKRAIIVDSTNRIVGMLTQSEVVNYAYGLWSRSIRKHAEKLEKLVSKLGKRAVKYKAEAMVDFLTGLGNFRAFQITLRREVDRYNRYKTAPLCLALLDIDSFKEINDEHGHSVGDVILSEFSGFLSDVIRDSDIAFRQGGDEFALLLPNTQIDQASTLADRILLCLQKYRFSRPISVRVSIGLGEIGYGLSQTEFVEHVDEALYKAKCFGKNICVSWSP